MLINSFWYGENISCLEQLTVQSFIDHGHDFCIWTYNTNIKKQLPEKTIIKNANKILDFSNFFTYNGCGDCNKGSIGGFSDIFRYFLLKHGYEWYVDMDVTCLNSFLELTEDIVLRPHKNTSVVANIIKIKGFNNILDEILEETKAKVTKNNDSWVLPLKIFKKHIFKNNLEKYIVPLNYFGNDDIKQIDILLRSNIFLKPSSLPKFAIHWCNTAISSGNWYNGKFFYNKTNPVKFSMYEFLLKKHNIRF